jgi:hypothetical protein
MNQADKDFSTQNVSPQLVSQIVDAVKNKAYGSVEIYIQNYNVVQITERTIRKIKTSVVKTVGNGKNGKTTFASRTRVLNNPRNS